MKKNKTKMVATLGLLLAIQIVLSRFLSISVWNFKVGFGFIPIAAAAILYGGFAAGILGACSDFLGAVLFPIGVYFPGFTVTAFLTGFVYGLFLHKKQSSIRIFAAVAMTKLVLHFLLNTFWISILYGISYQALISVRLIQSVLLTPVEFVSIYFLAKFIKRYAKETV